MASIHIPAPNVSCRLMYPLTLQYNRVSVGSCYCWWCSFWDSYWL